MSNIGFLPFSQPPAGGLGANSRGRRNFQDAQLNTLTVSDKTILNCVAINTDRLKCIDVLEMTGRAVFNGDVTFFAPVSFLDGSITLCDIDCPTDFTLTAGDDVSITAGATTAGGDVNITASNDINLTVSHDNGDIMINTDGATSGDITIRATGPLGATGDTAVISAGAGAPAPAVTGDAIFHGGNDVRVEAGAEIHLASTSNSDFSLTSASAADQTLILQAENSGTGKAIVTVQAVGSLATNDATLELFATAAAVTQTGTVHVHASDLIDIESTGAGGQVNLSGSLTTGGVTVTGHQVALAGSPTTGGVAVTGAKITITGANLLALEAGTLGIQMKCNNTVLTDSLKITNGNVTQATCGRL